MDKSITDNLYKKRTTQTTKCATTRSMSSSERVVLYLFDMFKYIIYVDINLLSK